MSFRDNPLIYTFWPILAVCVFIILIQEKDAAPPRTYEVHGETAATAYGGAADIYKSGFDLVTTPKWNTPQDYVIQIKCN